MRGKLPPIKTGWRGVTLTGRRMGKGTFAYGKRSLPEDSPVNSSETDRNFIYQLAEGLEFENATSTFLGLWQFVQYS